MVDHDFAIGLCTLLPKAEVFKILWKVIDNTWQNYDKILVGTLVALLYSIMKSFYSKCCLQYGRILVLF